MCFLNILKILKRMWFWFLLAIIFLIVQASCELTLPGYTSDIINIGIGNKGIVDSYPKVMRESEFKQILNYVNEDERQIVIDSYELISIYNISKKEYLSYKEKYPIIDNENIYINKKDSSNLVNILPKAIFKYQNKDDNNLLIDNTVILKYIENEYKTIGIDISKLQNNYILKTGIYMLFITFISMLASILVSFIGSMAASKFALQLREKVFSKILSFASADIKNFKTSSLITRTTNDVNRVQMVIIMALRTIVYAPIIGIGAVIKVLNSNASLTWIVGLGIVIILILMIILSIVALPKFEVVQKLMDKLNLTTKQIIEGIPVIRAFSNEEYEEKRFDKVNKKLEKINLFVERLMSIINPIISLVMNGVTLLILYEGSKKIDIGVIAFGDLFALIQYSIQVITSFIMISMVMVMIPRAIVSFMRINEILKYKVKIKNDDKATVIDDMQGLIEFNDVSFKYPNAFEYVLDKVSFTAEVGKVTAIVGSTGSGKSTLVNLLPRLYDVIEGSITIDKVDIRKIDLHNLRENIGYIAQKGILFSGTVVSNLKLGNNKISDEQMIRASKIALADEFINSKEDKYLYKIAQGGTNVSGGQKQRLSIARAIAKNPKIYIFDDSFSALDFKTDANLRRNIKNELKDSTVLIVAQRISTIMNADKIVVLDKGKVVGIGTHKQLLKKCKVYREIATSQLTKEELK